MNSTDRIERELKSRAKFLFTEALRANAGLFSFLSFIRKHKKNTNLMKAIADDLEQREQKFCEKRYVQTDKMKTMIDDEKFKLEFGEVIEIRKKIKDELQF